MSQFIGSLLLMMFLAAIFSVVGLSYLKQREWRRGSLWMAAATLTFILWMVVVSNDFLNRTLFYQSVNQTAYAPNFSLKGFNSLPIGASLAEIELALGPPLDSYRDETSGELWLYYSQHGKDWSTRNFWKKYLILDLKTMRLKRKYDQFYVP